MTDTDKADGSVDGAADGAAAIPRRARLFGPDLTTRTGVAFGVVLTASLTAAALLLSGAAEPPPPYVAPGGALSGAELVDEGDLVRPLGP